MSVETRDNAAQVEFWNGEAGRRWAAGQIALDRSLDPFGKAVLEAAAPKPGEHVMDVGCGAGATTLLAGTAVGPGGSVTGVDISQNLLHVATSRARDRTNVSFVQADAAVWTPPAPLDLVISRFGVMFFANPVAAFQNILKCLRPGGRIAFACWRPMDENPWMALPAQAAAPLFPPQPAAPPEAPGPFAFASAQRVTGILKGAAFTDVSVVPFDAAVEMASPTGGLEEAVQYALMLGPTARMVDGAAPELRNQAASAIRAILNPFASANGVRLSGATWIVTARRG